MKIKPKILAHRGCRAKTPENTLSSFEKAKHSKASGVEFDVWRCKSGEIVLCHDPQVALHSDGHGFIPKLTLKELRAFNFAFHHPDWPQKEPIPILEETLEFLYPMEIINIEVKTYHLQGFGIEKALCSLLKDHPASQKIIISSFSPKILLNFKRKLPEIKRALLLHPRQLPSLSLGLLLRLLKPFALHLPEIFLTKSLKERAQKMGIKLAPWTVNSLDFLKKCLELEVDYLFSDDPDFIWHHMNGEIYTQPRSKI